MDFSNTEIAFKYKKDKELLNSLFLFRLLSYKRLNRFFTKILERTISFFLVRRIIKSTVYKQFCGGEDIEACQKIINNIGGYGVKSILDNSIEGSLDEEKFEINKKEALKVIKKASINPSISFAVIKPSSLVNIDFIAKLHSKNILQYKEKESLERSKQHLEEVCKTAYDRKVKLFIDAEESWIQEVVDKWVIDIMLKMNKEQAIIFNTIQAYRLGRVESIKKWIAIAQKESFKLGLKIVRGAYMEKERERAIEQGYKSPIQPDKESTDKEFNECISLCAKYSDSVEFCCATHNEESTLLTIQLMKKNNIDRVSGGVTFAQLYGMSDNISFNLAQSGYQVSKYLPYSPVQDMLPYLIRRVDENPSISGQMGRELKLVKQEIQRRKLE